MSSLTIAAPAISDLTLEVMKRVIDENERTHKIEDPQGGPLPLAHALSDFFQLAAGLEQEGQQPDSDTATELAHYALDLFDRLSYQLRQLDIHDQRENIAGVFVSMAAWFARRDAALENLTGVADGFASLVNGTQESGELVALCRIGDEILEAATDEIKLDQDRSDPWRPWRVLNLNIGIAATRSLDDELMREVFTKLERRVPHDLPGFFADGKRQMDMQDVPQKVRDVMTEYSQKWPFRSSH